MVDEREETESYQVYEAVMKELGLPTLKTFLPDTKRSHRGQNTSRRFVSRPTLLLADRLLIRDSDLDKLIDELVELLKQGLVSRKEHDDGLDVFFIIDQAKSRNRPLRPYTPEKGEETSALSEPFDEVAASPATKEEGRRRRGKSQDYERLFIRNAPPSTRSGKTVYIHKESHERITRIVQVIDKNKLLLCSCLDNVPKQHLAIYQEGISELYKKRSSDIF